MKKQEKENILKEYTKIQKNKKVKNNCNNCKYNIGGICNHKLAFNQKTTDLNIESLIKKYPNGCYCYRNINTKQELKNREEKLYITITGELLESIKQKSKKINKPLTATVKYMLYNVLNKDI